MIICRLSHLEQRLKERGYTLDEVRPCIVSQDGDQITVDENHPSYPRQTKKNKIKTGPGTELKKLLSKIGINSKPNCTCNKRAAIMDQWGPDECEKRIDEIVGWLKEEATKRKLPFIEMAGKILVKKAIKNARKS